MVNIDGQRLTLPDVLRVSREYERVELAQQAVQKILAARELVDRIATENRSVYGINTGFGELAQTSISAPDMARLQENLIRSHAAGVGAPLDEDVTRAIMLLRVNALAKGHSGVRLEVIERLIQSLNQRLYPFIPSQGSVGASGDLAPLAHLALVLMGEGECWSSGQRVAAVEVMKEKGIAPIRLLAKEGLGLINGTQLMAGFGCLAVEDARLLLKNAQVAGAMSLEALKGTDKALDEKIHALRPYPGQVKVAANLRRLVKDSRIIASHTGCAKVQDAYTLRCLPQILGPIADTIDYAAKVLAIEINSATDNPLLFPAEGEIISGGNFHGQPLALVMDYLGIALSEMANVAERTIDRLVNPHVSGLPPFLSPNSGLHSGLMIAQYTAAALVSENKVLAHPASVDSIPTSAGQEDHVSMGSIAARKAAQIVKNVEQVLAIQMLCAAQGIDFHLKDFTPGQGTQAAHRSIRQHVPFWDEDRILYRDIEKVHHLVVHGDIVREVENVIGVID